MNRRSRREFLEDVGRGMLVASLGSAAALELGMVPCVAEEVGQRLTFGELEPLVSLMQETPPDKLLPLLVNKLNAGTELKTLVTAAALANARAFGGQDYTGYHTFMALVPAYQMAGELPAERQPLPVLKVLYRNSSRIQEQQADDHDVLHQVQAAAESVDRPQGGELLRDAVRAVDWNGAEARFAALAKGPVGEAYNHLQFAVQDEVNVHRVVLAWRAWAMLELSGEQYAHTLLRQSLRFCVDSEQPCAISSHPKPEVRDVLPRLLDEYRLVGKPLGDRPADDAWVEELAHAILPGTRDQAAEAAAAALAEGMDPEAVGEAISLAANLLVLHDPGRRQENSTPQKPPGCVHGDSVGVHASDCGQCLAKHRPRQQSAEPGRQFDRRRLSHGGPIRVRHERSVSLRASAGRDRCHGPGSAAWPGGGSDSRQRPGPACAVVHRYGELELPARPVFDLLLKYAVSEDGALHAEKYYRTVAEEFAATRPAFRWRQLVALARVTASEHGYPGAGLSRGVRAARRVVTHARNSRSFNIAEFNGSGMDCALSGLGSLAAVFLLTVALAANVGEMLTRNTVRLSLVWYAVALCLMMRLNTADWSAASLSGKLARWCWTWALVIFLIHVMMAFHFYHHWSHADAFERTRQLGGFGEGLYANYLFALLWTADVAYWWLRPARYAARSPWIDRGLHGFMLFMVLNSMVVFASGPIRWAGLTMFAVLVIAWSLARLAAAKSV